MPADAVRRLILWDVDHTLIETRGLGSELARAAFEEATGKKSDWMAVAAGRTEPVIFVETLDAEGLERSEEYLRRYAEALPAQYGAHVDQLRAIGRALPGAAEAIKALDQVPDLVQSVCTGNYRAVAAIKIQTFGLDEHLDLDVGAYADDGIDRADLVAVARERAARKYGCRFTRDNTVVIGDTTQDVVGAHKGGTAIVAVATGSDSLDELRLAGAEQVLANLADAAALVRAVTDA